MTTRVERSFDIAVPPQEVWEFIADPKKRADAISVVAGWRDEGDSFVWDVSLPIPFVRKTVSVRTRDIERVKGERVQFEGDSSVMRVTGEHELTPLEDGGTRVVNRFVVDGKLPGVEAFFNRNLDDELGNLEDALRFELTEP